MPGDWETIRLRTRCGCRTTSELPEGARNRLYRELEWPHTTYPHPSEIPKGVEYRVFEFQGRYKGATALRIFTEIDEEAAELVRQEKIDRLSAKRDEARLIKLDKAKEVKRRSKKDRP